MNVNVGVVMVKPVKGGKAMHYMFYLNAHKEKQSMQRYTLPDLFSNNKYQEILVVSPADTDLMAQSARTKN